MGSGRLVQARRVAVAAVVGVACGGVIGGGVGGVAAAGGATGPGVPRCGPTAPKLTVRGTGQATGTPDLLTLTLSVSTTAPTANGALDQNDQDAAAVTAALATGGVKGKNVQTTGLSVQPQFNKTGTVTGYSVTNSVVADVRQLSSAGAVIDAAAAAAGNAVRVSGLTFSIQDPRPLEDRARRDAVGQAVSDAAAMAAAAGQRLAGVCKVTDDSTAPVPVGQTFSSAAGTAGTVASVPLERGTQQATAQVTMVYSLAADPRPRE